MTKRSYGRGLLNLLPVLLFAVLAACVLSVLLTGTKLYSSLTQQDQQAYVNRTVHQYLCTKVQQAPSPSAVSVGDFEGESALILHHELDGESYLERIYCYDGWLWELFSSADSVMTPEDGEKLLELSEFSASLDDGLLSISFSAHSGTQTFYLDLSTEEASHEK